MKYTEQLAALLGRPTTPPQMGGAAGQAQQALSGRAYQLHQQEAKMLGQQPMTPEQFAATQK
jgi:hypothetical protein